MRIDKSGYIMKKNCSKIIFLSNFLALYNANSLRNRKIVENTNFDFLALAPILYISIGKRYRAQINCVKFRMRCSIKYVKMKVNETLSEIMLFLYIL
jgi:hypothetical protein